MREFPNRGFATAMLGSPICSLPVGQCSLMAKLGFIVFRQGLKPADFICAFKKQVRGNKIRAVVELFRDSLDLREKCGG